MINLLPYEDNKQIRAARTNLILFRFIVFLGLAIGFLVLACVTTYFLILLIQSQHKEISRLNDDTAYSNGAVQDPVNNYKSNLATAKNILDQNTSYYGILTNIGASLPVGTIIDSISIDDNSINSGINIKINSNTTGFEPKVREGFQKSSMFSNYQLIGTETTQTDQSVYKFSINISININKAAVR